MFNWFLYRLNPLQGPALNADPNQRLKETEIYRSNDNNYLPSDDYENFGEGKHCKSIETAWFYF